MIALIQRVSEASVSFETPSEIVPGAAETSSPKVSSPNITVNAIAAGIVALIGVERGDDETRAERLLDRILDYRIFSDEAGRMNRSLRETQGDLLLVPQFTLAADTEKGLRPGFSRAAPPEDGKRLFDYFVRRAQGSGLRIATGRFGAYMRVALVNDGPVTFWLHV